MRIWTLVTATLIFVACKPTEDNFDERTESAYCDRLADCDPDAECTPDDEPDDEPADPDDECEFDRDAAAACIEAFRTAECASFFGETIVVPPEECFVDYCL